MYGLAGGKSLKCPFIASRRMADLLPDLKTLYRHRVSPTINTKPLSDHNLEYYLMDDPTFKITQDDILAMLKHLRNAAPEKAIYILE